MPLVKLPRHSFFSAAMGTVIEYYDCTLFVVLLPIMAPLFFPSHTDYESVVKSFYVLLLSMFARPIGGIVLGHLGDYLGRRKALSLSMYGIAVATLAIGLTPTYASIGIAAPIILTLAKIVQVFCFGGEYNGAGIYVLEHAKNSSEGYVGSMLTATMLIGSLFAAIFGIVITLPHAPAYSWRLAYIAGAVMGVLGIMSRKTLLESPHFQKANPTQTYKKLIATYPLEIVAGFFVGAFATIPFTTTLSFLMPVLMAKHVITSQQFMIIQSCLILLGIISLIAAGIFADKKTPTRIMKYGAMALTILPLPLLLLADKIGLLGCLITAVSLILINEIVLGPSNAFLKNLFPPEYRYRGTSLGFTLGMSILGGLTPITENFLYSHTNSFAAISIWLIFLGLGTWISIIAIERKRSRIISQALNEVKTTAIA